MIHMEKFNREVVSDFYFVTILNNMNRKFWKMRKLRVSFENKIFCKLRSIYIGVAKLCLDVRHGADVIHMPVRQD